MAGREDGGVDQQQRGKAAGPEAGRQGHGVTAHGMTDADGVAEIQGGGERGEVGAKGGPSVRRGRFVAAAVSAGFDGEGAAAGQQMDDVVPDTAVVSGGVGEYQGWAGAGPVPHGEGEAPSGVKAEFGGPRGIHCCILSYPGRRLWRYGTKGGEQAYNLGVT